MYKLFHVVLLPIGLLLPACTANQEESFPTTTTASPSAPPTLPAPEVIDVTIQQASPTPEHTSTPTIPATMGVATAEPVAITGTPTLVTSIPITTITLEPVLTEGLHQVTFITHAYDNRLFVLERAGRVRIIENGRLVQRPFLDITDRVGSTSSERGLLGLAFHPNYSLIDATGSGQFYVNYTDLKGDTKISRFTVSESDSNLANRDSEVVYLSQNQPFPNHNGGSLAFGPDGYLYAGLGDGGFAFDPLQAGQDLSTLLGKILRLDVNSVADEYAIPPDNPFVGVDGARPEIWAYGLRNPWRFSFDRETGDFFIADVGQSQWEEVNFQPSTSSGGENYGWRIMEASHCLLGNGCAQYDLVLPIFEYDHSNGCSITGGYVYRGTLFPAMTGNYFVSDYCSGTIWRLFSDGAVWLADNVAETDLNISTFGEDVNGELYVANYWNGGIYHLKPGD